MAQLKSFNYLHAQTLQQIIQQVRDDYYELIAQKELTISAAANVENALATFEVAKAKYFLGIVDFLDLSQAKSPEDALFNQVDKRTRLISVSTVQYAEGLRMDLARISEYCREKNILLCLDAIQQLGDRIYNSPIPF